MSTTTSTRTQVAMSHAFSVSQQFTAVLVYVMGKQILSSMNVHLFVFLRLLFVVPITIIASILITRNVQAFKISRKICFMMFISAIISILISQTLVFMGLDRSTPTNTSIISAPCTPLFTALFSILRGTDKMSVSKGLGFSSSVVGALLLLQVWNFEFQGTTLGNLLIVGSSICSATNVQLQKYILNTGIHPLVAQAYICSMGIIAWICGYAGFGLFQPVAWDLTPKVWLYVSIVGAVATAIPWCIGIVALKHMSPLTVSVYTVLQPLIAVFVGVFLLGEVITWIQLAGGGLVLLGLIFVQATPLLQKLYQQYKKKANFELLPMEDEEKEEVELDVLSEVSTDEVEYKLSLNGETNDFVIPDGADFREIEKKEIEDTSLLRSMVDYKLENDMVEVDLKEKREESRGQRMINFTLSSSPIVRPIL